MKANKSAELKREAQPNLMLFSQSQSAQGETGGEEQATEQTEQETAREEACGEEIPDAQSTEESSEKKLPGESSQAALNVLRAVREALEQREHSRQTDSLIRSWEAQAEELKKTYPGFLLEEQVKNPDFAALLKAGVPLRKAYEAANLEEIIASAIRCASVAAAQRAAQSVLSIKERPQENGVQNRASSIKHTDVQSLTQSDIMQILDKVSRGAKISFG